MGFVTFKGNKIEVEKEFILLLNKAKEAFDDLVISSDSFKIIKKDIQISFTVSNLSSTEYAIFQIIT